MGAPLAWQTPLNDTGGPDVNLAVASDDNYCCFCNKIDHNDYELMNRWASKSLVEDGRRVKFTRCHRMATGNGGKKRKRTANGRDSWQSEMGMESGEPLMSKVDTSQAEASSGCDDDNVITDKDNQPNSLIASGDIKDDTKKATMTGDGSSENGLKQQVLDPYGSLSYYFSIVVSLAFLYNFWSISYRIAFREIDSTTVAFWFALDYSADFIYVLDIVVNYRTGYFKNGVLQKNLNEISEHYRESTRFYLDCLCLLPLDVLYISFGYNSILRFTRLFKIYKFWALVDRTERHTNYPNVFLTLNLLHYILVIIHWNACIFHMISKNGWLDIEFLYKMSDDLCQEISCHYLRAFYYSIMTLTNIGDLRKPRTRGEYLYVTVELFLGLFLIAAVLGHVANIVTNVSAARKEFQAKLDAVKTFMRMRRVSQELQCKVIRWFDYLWSSKKSGVDDESMAYLPDRLKAEIAIHVHLETLKRVDVFQNTEAGFLCELVLRLKPVLFSPGDFVCRKNEVGHEMYIVSRGVLEVVAEGGGQVVATLLEGSYFGEISVLNVGRAGNRRTASVRSVGYSDLFCLSKQDLWDVLRNYPKTEARIRARAEERLQKLGVNSGSSNNNNNGGSSNNINGMGRRPLPKQLPGTVCVGSQHTGAATATSYSVRKRCCNSSINNNCAPSHSSGGCCCLDTRGNERRTNRHDLMSCIMADLNHDTNSAGRVPATGSALAKAQQRCTGGLQNSIGFNKQFGCYKDETSGPGVASNHTSLDLEEAAILEQRNLAPSGDSSTPPSDSKSSGQASSSSGVRATRNGAEPASTTVVIELDELDAT